MYAALQQYGVLILGVFFIGMLAWAAWDSFKPEKTDADSLGWFKKPKR